MKATNPFLMKIASILTILVLLMAWNTPIFSAYAQEDGGAAQSESGGGDGGDGGSGGSGDGGGDGGSGGDGGGSDGSSDGGDSSSTGGDGGTGGTGGDNTNGDGSAGDGGTGGTGGDATNESDGGTSDATGGDAGDGGDGGNSDAEGDAGDGGDGAGGGDANADSNTDGSNAGADAQAGDGGSGGTGGDASGDDADGGTGGNGDTGGDADANADAEGGDADANAGGGDGGDGGGGGSGGGGGGGSAPNPDASSIVSGNGTSTAETNSDINITDVGLDTASTTDESEVDVLGAATYTGTTSAETNTGESVISDEDGINISGQGLSRATDWWRINIALLDSSFGVRFLLNPLENVVSFVTDLLEFFARGLVSGEEECGDKICDSGITTIDIEHSTDITRAIESFCNSGGDDGGYILTGPCKAVLNAIGMANWVALNSNIMALILEHDSDLNADIMLPEPSFFEALRGGSFVQGTDLTIEQNGTTTLAVGADANSGDSTATDSVDSGDTLASGKNVNMLNEINPPTCFVIAVGGDWNGGVYQLPDGFARTDVANGLSLVCGRGTGEGDAKAYEGIIKQDVDLVMNALSGAMTGNNEGTAAVTGDAIACAHTLNVNNIVLLNEDWTLGFFSICGDWNGDLLFGARPDASPEEQAVSNLISRGGSGSAANVLNHTEPGITMTKTSSVEQVTPPATVEYELVIFNNGGDAQDVVVVDTMRGPDGSVIGKQAWNLGSLKRNEEVKITYSIEFEGNVKPGYYTNTAILTGKRSIGNGSVFTPIKTTDVIEVFPFGDVLGESCEPLLTEYIRPWKVNSPDQVTKLQGFLNTYEGEELGETGIYDSATIAAVKRFQTKYKTDVLTPWGITWATGNVYYTTQKKVNSIVCENADFSLTPAQQAEIDAFKTKNSAEQEEISSEGNTGSLLHIQNLLMIPLFSGPSFFKTDASLGQPASTSALLKQELQKTPLWAMFAPFVEALEL